MFEKLDMKTINFTDENIKKIAEIFPNVISEDENGKVIDFEALKQELSGNIVEGYKERYSLNWPGKREAQLKANTPTTKTLRPCIEDSVNFDTTENLYIEGDNLDVLKILQEGYLNKIKMIYIDPPYNTGNDFIYNDNFTRDTEEELLESGQIDEDGGKLVANPETNGKYHSDWLSMIYPRLKLSRNLLKEDGVIFISIGEDEVSNLEKITNEIFGEHNKLGLISRVQKKGSDKGTYFKPTIDYMLVYARNSINVPGFRIGIDESKFKEIEKDGARKGERYESSKSLYQSSLDPMRGCQNQRYYIECPDGSFAIPKGDFYPDIKADGEQISPKSSDDGVWRWSRDSYLQQKDLLVFKNTSSSPLVDENANQSKWNIYTKRYLKDAQEKGNVPSNLFEGFLNSKATTELKSLDLNFSFSKPVELIEYLIDLVKIENEYVLDFFSGSGTTAHAVISKNIEIEKQNKFILVQLAEEINANSGEQKSRYKNICDLARERIRRAGKKIVEESGKTDLDIGFRVLKLDSSNMKDIYFNPNEISQNILDHTIDNIKDNRSDLDLLFGVLIDWGVDLTLPIIKETIQEKDCYFVDSDSLCAYFGNDINEEFIKELAKKEALRFVFKDSSFGNNDDLKDNVSQIFKQLNPQAEIKVI